MKLGDVSAFSVQAPQLPKPAARFLERYPDMVEYHEQLQHELDKFTSNLNTAMRQALAATKGS